MNTPLANRLPKHLAGLLLLTPLLSAQSLTLSATSPGFLQASAGGQTQVTPTPSGPLSTQSPLVLQAQAGSGSNSATASMTWSVGGASGLDFLAIASCFASGNGQTQVIPGDFLLNLSAPTSGTVTLNLTQMVQSTSLLAPLQMRIDVDNDGVDEMTEQMTAPQQYVRTIGAAPLQIRVRMQATAPLRGFAQLTLGVAVSAGPHTQVQALSTGCMNLPFAVTASPFGESLLFAAPCLGTCAPRVVVLGLSVQPQVLPSLNSWCGLLLPAPDALLYSGPGVSYHGIPLPAAARPIDIFAQSVWVFPNALVTSDSFRIAAY